MDFISMWSQVTDEQIRKIQSEFALDVIVLALICYLLSLSMQYQQNCGIPIKAWLLGFFIIYFSKSSFQMIKIFVLTNFYDYRICYDFTAFILINGIMIGWIIYGYVIFYSDANNCDRVPDTAYLNSLMFVILFIGYIFIFLYLMLLCTLPCVYSIIREANQHR